MGRISPEVSCWVVDRLAGADDLGLELVDLADWLPPGEEPGSRSATWGRPR